MKTNAPLESVVQRKLIEHYTKLGYIVVKISLCNINGFPDLLLLKDGVASFIEVKRPGGKPTTLQLVRHEQLRKAGFRVEVIDHT